MPILGNIIGKEKKFEKRIKTSTKKSKRQTIQKDRTQSNGSKALNGLRQPGYR